MVTLRVWRKPSGVTARNAHGNLSNAPVRFPTADEDGWTLAPPYMPTDAGEPEEPGRDAVVTDLTAYRRGAATRIVATDEVEFGQGRHRVIGPPAQWPNPRTGGNRGCVMKLRRVDG